MQILVKVLSGKEIALEVDESEEISAVKKMIGSKLGVPFDQQRLVFKGSTLANASSLNDYRIINNSKLHLFIKKTTSQTQGASSNRELNLWTELKTFLNKHFSESDTEIVLKHFKEDFKGNLDSLSLDDLERLGKYHLNQSVDS